MLAHPTILNSNVFSLAELKNDGQEDSAEIERYNPAFASAIIEVQMISTLRLINLYNPNRQVLLSKNKFCAGRQTSITANFFLHLHDLPVMVLMPAETADAGVSVLQDQLIVCRENAVASLQKLFPSVPASVIEDEFRVVPSYGAFCTGVDWYFLVYEHHDGEWQCRYSPKLVLGKLSPPAGANVYKEVVEKICRDMFFVVSSQRAAIEELRSKLAAMDAVRKSCK